MGYTCATTSIGTEWDSVSLFTYVCWCVHVSVICVGTRMCVDAYVREFKVDIGVFFDCSLFYILRHGLYQTKSSPFC